MGRVLAVALAIVPASFLIWCFERLEVAVPSRPMVTALTSQGARFLVMPTRALPRPGGRSVPDQRLSAAAPGRGILDPLVRQLLCAAA